MCIIEPEAITDERGFFARTWCQQELDAQGLSARLAQCSVSYSPRKGTLRGMHFQVAPCEETKVVTCLRGSIFDVVLDLRPTSPQYCRWFGITLASDRLLAVYVPPGCAHGFLTLTPDSLVQYFISEPHAPEAARGVRYDDPAFGIDWPAAPEIVSTRDRTYPDFRKVVP